MAKQEWKPGNMLYPLPAVMVSCQRPGEKPNIITVAWTGTVCTNPPMAYISVRPERYSYDIIRETGEFVINLTTEKLAEAVDYCGVRSGRDTDKFQDMHLTPEPSSKIGAPMIGECPVNLECVVEKVEELGSHHMFLAKVVAVHVDEAYMDEKGKIPFKPDRTFGIFPRRIHRTWEKIGDFWVVCKEGAEEGRFQTQEKSQKKLDGSKRND